MDYGTMIFFAVFAFIAGRFVHGRLKYGSWSGAFLKGSITRTVGQVELASGIGSQKLTVQLMSNSDNSEEFVGLVIVAKAALAASMQPYRLSKTQARELAGYLDQAAQ